MGIHTTLKDRNVIQLASDLLSQFPEVEDALQLAAYAHDGQIRKEIRAGATYHDPYVIHPIRVALRIARWGVFTHAPQRDATLRAALLHDAMEDAADRVTEYLELPAGSRDALNLAFTHPGVADTVRRVTNPVFPAGGDEKRKAYLAHLEEKVLHEPMALVVKASDLVDNAGSLKHIAPSEKRSTLAAKYREPVDRVIHALNDMAHRPGRHTPSSQGTGFEFVRGMHRAAQRLEIVAVDLDVILAVGE